VAKLISLVVLPYLQILEFTVDEIFSIETEKPFKYQMQWGNERKCKFKINKNNTSQLKDTDQQMDINTSKRSCKLQ